MADQQSYANHRQYVPGYHWVTTLLVMVFLVYAIKVLVSAVSGSSIMGLVGAMALFGTAYYARSFAIKVQDRLIRLEERLRMERLLPEDLKAKVDGLSLGQFVALRFASDGELADLVKRTLAGEFAKPDDIKKAIKTWRPDHDRA